MLADRRRTGTTLTAAAAPLIAARCATLLTELEKRAHFSVLAELAGLGRSGTAGRTGT